MKILITADPFIPVPPIHYGGIERILDMIIREYIAFKQFEQVCQLLVKGQPAERTGRRLASLCFLSLPACSCHLLHAS